MDVVALQVIHAHVFEECRHIGVFHLLGHRMHAEIACQLGDRTDDGLVAPVVQHAAHEGAVDLEEIGGQVLEIEKRGGVASEIVQCELAAAFAQAMDQALGVAEIDHCGGFRHFEAEARAFHAIVIEHVADHAEEGFVGNGLAREVDEIHRIVVGLRRQVGHHGFQHPAVEDGRLSVTLEGRQQLGRSFDHAIALPADQHFVVRLAAARRRLDQLAIGQELVGVQRLGKIGRPAHFRFQTAESDLVRLVQHDASAPLRLGAVARHVSLDHEVAGRGRGLGDRGDAGAGAKGEAPPLVFEAEVADALHQLTADPVCLVGPGVEQDEAEFVPAQTAQVSVCGQGGFHGLGNVHQQGIADRMAAGVVHQLELVEVDVAERMLLPEIARGA